jgi:hypothetical protein
MLGHRGVLSTWAWANVILTFAGAVTAKAPDFNYLPSLRDQAALINGWREERLAGIPALLQKHGVDAWLVS